MTNSSSPSLPILRASLEGELYDDQMMRTIYATDASVYRELPQAVAMPKHAADLKQLVHFAKSASTSLIPRAAGTSLAGQCVGNGIVVDTSRHFTQILEVNQAEQWVRVQPGVVRDELNHSLRPYGLFFGPNTSTANRAMIGGMVGNNSCGSYSIVYGTTRQHVLELHCVLSDGSEVIFGEISPETFAAKCEINSLEGQIYRHIRDELSNKEVQEEIHSQFPRPSIHRRNTGYAVDELLKSAPFQPGGKSFNFCQLLTGSEGTLALITEVKLHVDPLPPPVLGLLCVHFSSVRESLQATVVAMKHQPRAVELMDRIIMDCTKENRLYQNHRFFLQGEPEAVLIIETGGETPEAVAQQLDEIEAALKADGYGYHFPRVLGPKINQVWDLRKAGLGLLANIPGDPKAVAVIEDTAVAIEDLPDYIEEFSAMMTGFDQQAVYYAHAGAGELHLRPILDLKRSKDRGLFREIGHASAQLVKKYQGSLSGEHGDGRVRAEFIPLMVGEKNYELFRRIKATWDPQNLFNPGKIVDAAPMDTALRYEADQEERTFETLMDFSDQGGILRAAEKCNGSADCRKSPLAGGTMCPSYMATRNEKDTTRARANTLREVLTQSTEENPFAQPELYEVMDLCLSCKGCASECPSNVNVANLKAEFLHQYYQTHGIPLRAKAMANVGRLNQLGSIWPGLTNFFLAGFPSGLTKRVLGMAQQRTLPKLHQSSLRKWFQKHQDELTLPRPKAKVYFFADEFTNFLDTDIGITSIRLLHQLGYQVEMPEHSESGRAHLSKGLLKEARRMAIYNVNAFRHIVDEDTPLIGVEPSAILSFRDEYPRLVIPELQEDARKLGTNSLMLEEFLLREMKAGRITAADFHSDSREILLHGHCHQKALASTDPTKALLSLPENYAVQEIPSGCCGMAGSFGYEKEHYELSMQIGELVLFPAVRESETQTLIAAPGTSCRHQIWDGTKRKALHPAEILWDAVKK